jgi:predicted amidohydrolase
MKNVVRVGAVSPSIKGDRFEVMKKYVEGQDLDLIVFPEEFFGTDFVTDKPTYISREEVVREVSALAKDNDVHIVTGFLEAIGDGKFYNEALLFSPEGLVGTHTKTVLTEGEINSGCLAGDKVEVFNTKIGKIAMFICWEVWFPELSRIAALKGAEIICFPTGTDINVKKDKAWLTLWWARAVENDVYVVQSINAKGSITSVIYSPEKILAIGRKEGMITAELDMDRLKKMREGTVKTRIESALLKRRSPFLRKIGETIISNAK